MGRRGGGAAGRALTLRTNWYETLRVLLSIATGLATAVTAALAGLHWQWASAIAVASAVLMGTTVLDAMIAHVVDPVRHWYNGHRARREHVLAVLHEATPAELAQVDPYKMGVFASAAAEDYRDPTEPRPPYFGRIIDDQLRGAIEGLATADGGVVVVKGHPKAGKSRTLWEALAAVEATRTRTVYALRPPDGRSTQTSRPLDTFVSANLKVDGDKAVLWIDDAHEHFEYGLTLDQLQKLAARYPGLIIAMTVHTRNLDPPPRHQGQLSAVDTSLLCHLDELATGHELAVELNETERTAARQQYPGLEERIDDPSDFKRLPGWFAGVSYLQRRYRNHRHDNPGGVAVAKAAIDWRRAGMPVGMSLEQLRELAEIELDQLGHGTTFTDSNYEAALAWAKGEDADSDPKFKGIGLLRPVPGSRGALWRDFDAITAWAPTDDGPLTDRCWIFVLKHLTEDTAFSVGAHALYAGELSIAETAFRASANMGDARAMSNLGIVLAERGSDKHTAEAEHWFRRGAELYDPNAMVNLGHLLAERGGDENTAEAQRWYRRAAKLDHPGAMYSLGLLFAERGGDKGLAGAQRWYRRAIELGDVGAMYNLGLLLAERGGEELAQAEHLFRGGAELDDLNAMTRLGVMLIERGGDKNRTEAQHWFQRAAERGGADAMTNLGVLLTQLGGDANLAEAKRWYRRAIEFDSTNAMNNLGLLFMERGGEDDLAEAEHWLRRAIELGNTHAVTNLGVVLMERGGDENLAEAEHWFRLAADLGVTTAMMNLGVVLAERGGDENLAEAEHWFRLAIEAGDARAMDSLAYLLAVLRSDEKSAEAERWFQQARRHGVQPPLA